MICDRIFRFATDIRDLRPNGPKITISGNPAREFFTKKALRLSLLTLAKILTINKEEMPGQNLDIPSYCLFTVPFHLSGVLTRHQPRLNLDRLHIFLINLSLHQLGLHSAQQLRWPHLNDATLFLPSD